jgi:hypothetical protein
MRTFFRAALPVVLVLALAPAVDGGPAPIVGVFPITCISQQQVTGHVISPAPASST